MIGWWERRASLMRTRPAAQLSTCRERVIHLESERDHLEKQLIYSRKEIDILQQDVRTLTSRVDVEGSWARELNALKVVRHNLCDIFLVVALTGVLWCGKMSMTFIIDQFPVKKLDEENYLVIALGIAESLWMGAIVFFILWETWQAIRSVFTFSSGEHSHGH